MIRLYIASDWYARWRPSHGARCARRNAKNIRFESAGRISILVVRPQKAKRNCATVQANTLIHPEFINF